MPAPLAPRGILAGLVLALAPLPALPASAGAQPQVDALARYLPPDTDRTFAGTLGVRLGGRTEYRHGVENRPLLGTGAAPTTPRG